MDKMKKFLIGFFYCKVNGFKKKFFWSKGDNDISMQWNILQQFKTMPQKNI